MLTSVVNYMKNLRCPKCYENLTEQSITPSKYIYNIILTLRLTYSIGCGEDFRINQICEKNKNTRNYVLVVLPQNHLYHYRTCSLQMKAVKYHVI